MSYALQYQSQKSAAEWGVRQREATDRVAGLRGGGAGVGGGGGGGARAARGGADDPGPDTLDRYAAHAEQAMQRVRALHDVERLGGGGGPAGGGGAPAPDYSPGASDALTREIRKFEPMGAAPTGSRGGGGGGGGGYSAVEAARFGARGPAVGGAPGTGGLAVVPSRAPAAAAAAAVVRGSADSDSDAVFAAQLRGGGGGRGGAGARVRRCVCARGAACLVRHARSRAGLSGTRTSAVRR